jgi:uncharacterized membrane protein
VLVVLGLTFLGKVNAFQYSTVVVNDNITQISPYYSYSTVDYLLTLHNLTSSKFNLSIPLGIEDLNITDLNQSKITQYIYPKTSCHTFSISAGCEVIQLNNVKSGQTINILYRYYQNYTNGGLFNSTIYFIPSSFVSLLNVDMILPKGAYIPDNAYSAPSIYSIVQENNRFEVKWVLINQSYINVSGYYINLPFTVSYELNITQKKPSMYNYANISIVIAVIAIAIIAYFFIFVFSKRKNSKGKNKLRKSKRNNQMYKILSTDEMKVLKAISKDKFVYQADVIKTTGFSKVKVSKIISKLFRYGLIKIKPDGRTNKIKRI